VIHNSLGSRWEVEIDHREVDLMKALLLGRFKSVPLIEDSCFQTSVADQQKLTGAAGCDSVSLKSLGKFKSNDQGKFVGGNLSAQR